MFIHLMGLCCASPERIVMLSLTRRGVLGITGCCCCFLLVGSHAGSAAAESAPPRTVLRLPRDVAGISIPDSRLARDAADLAYDKSPAFLFNHCMRVFALSTLIAKSRKWEWDEEVVFVASALHDISLLPEFDRPDKTFEMAGADYARDFAKKREVSDARADLIHEGIARHTVLGTPGDVKSVAMIKLGAGLDVFGFGCSEVPPSDLSSVLQVFPRLEFKTSFAATLVSYKTHHLSGAGEGGWIDQFPENGISNTCFNE